MKRKPFEDVNVLDLTWAGVGPNTISYLGFYGATIVKMESQKHPDVLRSLGPFKGGTPHFERSYYYAYVQTAKRNNITLDLNKPKGIEVFKKLVRWADVVADSYAGGQMEKWGLDYNNLAKIKPIL
jgi:benzylsuccinate CoA-transferase BbsF subunit